MPVDRVWMARRRELTAQEAPLPSRVYRGAREEWATASALLSLTPARPGAPAFLPRARNLGTTTSTPCSRATPSGSNRRESSSATGRAGWYVRRTGSSPNLWCRHRSWVRASTTNPHRSAPFFSSDLPPPFLTPLLHSTDQRHALSPSPTGFRVRFQDVGQGCLGRQLARFVRFVGTHAQHERIDASQSRSPG